MLIDDGSVQLPVIAAASVATPPTGKVELFFDASNGNRLSQKDSTGTVRDLSQKSDAVSSTPAAGATDTLNLLNSNEFRVQFPAGNITLALSNESTARRFLIALTQDSVGGRTVTWFSTIKWAGGVVPTLTSTPNKRDVFGFVRTGANTYDGYVVGQNI